ncbi:Uncharacterized protein HZ326_29026 [Fusarium oxysporum f. sp. albedinis]|nr:Uncharacterized protein HZ326_29026 [Fusarium oxysporum f. sp. albedinis]
MQVIGLALVLALFFAPFDNDYYSVQNRMGFVQEIGAFYFVGMLQNTAIYPNERDVFYREDDDGVYSVHAFLAAYTILEVPFEIISCMIFGVLGVIAVDLPRTATLYFVSVFACFGIVSCGESLGIMFNTLFGHTGFAVNIMGVFLALANTMAGILSIDMPELFKAFNYLSPIRYGTRAVAPMGSARLRRGSRCWSCITLMLTLLLMWRAWRLVWWLIKDSESGVENKGQKVIQVDLNSSYCPIFDHPKHQQAPTISIILRLLPIYSEHRESQRCAGNLVLLVVSGMYDQQACKMSGNISRQSQVSPSMHVHHKNQSILPMVEAV